MKGWSRRWGASAAFLLLAGALFYFVLYYPADQTALGALSPDADIQIGRTDYGWYFDGPGEDSALIFYPGAKVEETAYTPLLRRIASGGTDVFLVRAPLHFALLCTNVAEEIQSRYDYPNWYIGGHSLGGIAAEYFVEKHPGSVRGVIFCASYPTRQMDDGLKAVMIYGTNDNVVNMASVEMGTKLSPAMTVYVIEGGNHAQFGNYGYQRGDGEATISAEEQQKQAADEILSVMAG